MNVLKNPAYGFAALLLGSAFFCCACKNAALSEQVLEETAIEAPTEAVTEVKNAEDDTPKQMESVMDVVCAASGIAAMEDGSLLVTDTYEKVIWKVFPENKKSEIFSGSETVLDVYGEPVGGYNDADSKESFFQCPWAIAPFLDGWAVSDADNNVIRLVANGKVQTINGSTKEKLKKTEMGVVFAHPTGLAADEEGNLYVSDTYNGAIRKITPTGTISTVVKKLEDPMGLCYKDGVLYVAETGANRIVKVIDGKAETLAGCGENDYLDGEAMDAAFAFPQGVTVADDGTVYVADTGNSAIRMIKDGKVSTLAARDRTSMDISPISPVGMLIQGNELYICDNFSRKVLRISLQ